jgi:hypothetical protein
VSVCELLFVCLLFECFEDNLQVSASTGSSEMSRLVLSVVSLLALVYLCEGELQWVAIRMTNLGCDHLKVRAGIFNGRWTNKQYTDEVAPPNVTLRSQERIDFFADDSTYERGNLYGTFEVSDALTPRGYALVEFNFTSSSGTRNDFGIEAAENVRYKLMKLPRSGTPLGWVVISIEKLGFFHPDVITQKRVINERPKWWGPV